MRVVCVVGCEVLLDLLVENEPLRERLVVDQEHFELLEVDSETGVGSQQVVDEADELPRVLPADLLQLLPDLLVVDGEEREVVAGVDGVGEGRHVEDRHSEGEDVRLEDVVQGAEVPRS